MSRTSGGPAQPWRPVAGQGGGPEEPATKGQIRHRPDHPERCTAHRPGSIISCPGVVTSGLVRRAPGDQRQAQEDHGVAVTRRRARRSRRPAPANRPAPGPQRRRRARARRHLGHRGGGGLRRREGPGVAPGRKLCPAPRTSVAMSATGSITGSKPERLAEPGWTARRPGGRPARASPSAAPHVDGSLTEADTDASTVTGALAYAGGRYIRRAGQLRGGAVPQDDDATVPMPAPHHTRSPVRPASTSPEDGADDDQPVSTGPAPPADDSPPRAAPTPHTVTGASASAMPVDPRRRGRRPAARTWTRHPRGRAYAHGHRCIGVDHLSRRGRPRRRRSGAVDEGRDTEDPDAAAAHRHRCIGLGGGSGEGLALERHRSTVRVDDDVGVGITDGGDAAAALRDRRRCRGGPAPHRRPGRRRRPCRPRWARPSSGCRSLDPRRTRGSPGLTSAPTTASRSVSPSLDGGARFRQRHRRCHRTGQAVDVDHEIGGDGDEVTSGAPQVDGDIAVDLGYLGFLVDLNASRRRHGRRRSTSRPR